MSTERKDTWASGDLYEPYVGRWSRLVARKFLEWLDVPAGNSWLDVGCGTGALTGTILEMANPSSVMGIDASEGFVSYAAGHLLDERASFAVGDARDLPVHTARFDAVVSGLMLNFVPDPQQALSEMKRAARNGGTVALYLWDYAEKMEFMRYFWDAAAALNPDAPDEGTRFPLCRPEPLRELFDAAGLRSVEVRSIDIQTPFHDFDDYWTPFLGGQGSAPSYVATLTEEERTELREHLRRTLPIRSDGSIRLVARAWAVRGTE